jgi:hypothetical protein
MRQNPRAVAITVSFILLGMALLAVGVVFLQGGEVLGGVASLLAGSPVAVAAMSSLSSHTVRTEHRHHRHHHHRSLTARVMAHPAIGMGLYSEDSYLVLLSLLLTGRPSGWAQNYPASFTSARTRWGLRRDPELPKRCRCHR